MPHDSVSRMCSEQMHGDTYDQRVYVGLNLTIPCPAQRSHAQVPIGSNCLWRWRERLTPGQHRVINGMSCLKASTTRRGEASRLCGKCQRVPVNSWWPGGKEGANGFHEEVCPSRQSSAGGPVFAGSVWGKQHTQGLQINLWAGSTWAGRKRSSKWRRRRARKSVASGHVLERWL